MKPFARVLHYICFVKSRKKVQNLNWSKVLRERLDYFRKDADAQYKIIYLQTKINVRNSTTYVNKHSLII